MLFIAIIIKVLIQK